MLLWLEVCLVPSFSLLNEFMLILILRVVPLGKVVKIGDYSFQGYGSHTNAYPVPYLTIACSIGAAKTEMETFLKRLEVAIKDVMKKKTLATILVSDSSKESVLSNESSSTQI
jgi:hypothetical protein